MPGDETLKFGSLPIERGENMVSLVRTPCRNLVTLRPASGSFQKERSRMTSTVTLHSLILAATRSYSHHKSPAKGIKGQRIV
jgi:hypothetical protein